MIKRQSIKSSNLESIGYDPESEILEVEFKGGGIYRYHKVPSQIWDEFQQAKSKGSHFHAKIKNKFEFKHSSMKKKSHK